MDLVYLTILKHHGTFLKNLMLKVSNDQTYIHICFLWLRQPDNKLGGATAGVGKVRPAGQIRPTSSVHPARGGSSVLTLNSAGKR